MPRYSAMFDLIPPIMPNIRWLSMDKVSYDMYVLIHIFNIGTCRGIDCLRCPLAHNMSPCTGDFKIIESEKLLAKEYNRRNENGNRE